MSVEKRHVKAADGVPAHDVWDYQCPIGYPECGKEQGDSFTSVGWDRKADAEERGRQHAAEHEAGRDLILLRAELVTAHTDPEVSARKPKTIQAELDKALEKARMPELVDFNAERGNR